MKYQIYQNPRNNQFYCKLRARNGWPYLTSQPHPTRKEVENTIEILRSAATDDDNFERKTTKNGRYYYEVVDERRAAMAVSRLYKSVTSMNRAIRKVKKIAPTSKVTILLTSKVKKVSTKKKPREMV